MPPNTHVHSYVRDFTVQRTGKTKYFPPQIHSHILQQVFTLPMFLNACLQSQSLLQRHVVSAFPQEEWSNRESINSLMLSHKCKCAHMIFFFCCCSSADHCLHTHTHNQTTCNITCLRSTDLKKRKKSPGYRFDFWLFGEKGERGREDKRDGLRSRAKYWCHFFAFLGGVTGRPELIPPP